MKKLFNKTTIISASIAAVICTVSILGVYISSTGAKNNYKENVAINHNAKNFFINQIVDYENSINIKFNIHKFRNLCLYTLTNWHDVSDSEQVKFIANKINKNILNLIKVMINDNYQFFNDDDLYINAKYNFISDQKIIIDARWSNRTNLVNNTNIVFYWNKFSLEISDIMQ